MGFLVLAALLGGGAQVVPLSPIFGWMSSPGRRIRAAGIDQCSAARA